MTDPMVLVVDDDDDVREATAAILAAEGYRTIGAAHGKEALAILQNGARVGAIVLDLKMPVMDGVELRKLLRADPALARIPVVVVTAGGKAPKDLGFDFVLDKPYPAEALLAVMEECIPRAHVRAVDDAEPFAPPRR
jgi:CheY-like chemotaxis protein